MRALTVRPKSAGTIRVEDVPDPVGDGEVVVHGLAVGVCGTDQEIVRGDYGWSPPGRDRLVLGHESLGRVESAPPDSSFSPGDLVVGVVRRPDPVPCGACARGEWDMCRNGEYVERGIKQVDGYASETWTVPEEFLVAVDPGLGLLGVLTEPTSVVAKAWEQVDRVGGRAWFEPERVLVTGAGPIGLLAAMIGVQRGLDVHVLDRVTDGVKPEIVRDLGATYHHGSVADVAAQARPDVVIEATGAGRLVLDAMDGTGSYGIVCLTGVSPTGHTLRLDAGGLNRELVLENDAVVGSVNANLRHYRAAADALAAADRSWLRRLVTTVLPLDRATSAFDEPPQDDVKVVIALDEEITA
ncbi:glucose 1-dehydrogenase [Nocardioides marmoribigeumensis]|uniref:Threonine dehydrogenase-like Zn-dependent dehydrogenase n=1 Tax=Nocardioides marmoribigeumensis TaxID=433649 RepID=A0ABU2BPX1_9ACTN|nr:glucose 1-dehydrogenase [Nocardioides marmoribigeumensis]MDR7360683.1 threonine dehydrogenase-like Zn-dependent dehydrogenase [Nocardioides marmoribigeumensis]